MNKMWKKVLAAATVVGMLAIVAGCGKQETAPASKKVNVVASIYPVYDVVKQVGGEHVDVAMLVAPGAEAHDWEPSPENIRQIGASKVFFYNGLGMEPVEKLLTKEVLKEAKAVELAQAPGVTVLSAGDEDHDEHEHEHGDAHKDHDHDKDKEHKEEHHHHHGAYDPHVWLDPHNVAAEAMYVAKVLSEVDPDNAAYYEKRAKEYKEELEKLDKEYEAWRAEAPVHDLVVSHKAYGYLAHWLGLEQEGILGISPDAEPTPTRMKEIVEFVREHDVHAIFTEELLNTKLAEAIAKETGAKTYMLNPIESVSKEQLDKNVSYVELMRSNLKVLKEAYPMQ